MLSVWLCVCGNRSYSLHVETCNVAHTDLLMNPMCGRSVHARLQVCVFRGYGL